MIISFQNKQTELLFRQGHSPRFPSEIWIRAVQLLLALNRAKHWKDLSTVPAHQLKKLVGDRKGQYSLRVNHQWRLCFFWDEAAGNASQVELVDYH